MLLSVEQCCCGVDLRIGAFVCTGIFDGMAFLNIIWLLRFERNELAHYKIWGCLGALDELDGNETWCELVNERNDKLKPAVRQINSTNDDEKDPSYDDAVTDGETGEEGDDDDDETEINWPKITIHNRNMYNTGIHLFYVKGLALSIACLIFSSIGIVGVYYKNPLLILVFLIYGLFMVIVDTVLSFVVLCYLFQTAVMTVTFVAISYLGYTIIWNPAVVYCLVVCDSYRHKIMDVESAENGGESK